MIKSSHFPLRWRGRHLGPFPLHVIQEKLEAHEIGLLHEVQADGEWMTLEVFYQRRQAELAASPAGPGRLLPPRGPAFPAAGNSGVATGAQADGRLASGIPIARPVAETVGGIQTGKPASSAPRPRRRLGYVLLGLFLGYLGAHNFYAGFWPRGLLQVALTALLTATAFTERFGVGLIVTWFWALLEVILVSRDRWGRPLA